MVCPSCQVTLEPSMRFCPQCGHEAIPPPENTARVVPRRSAGQAAVVVGGVLVAVILLSVFLDTGGAAARSALWTGTLATSIVALALGVALRTTSRSRGLGTFLLWSALLVWFVPISMCAGR